MQGLLRGRTFSAPRKSMKGKGRVTIQFGCCYNYAIDREGRQPGMLSILCYLLGASFLTRAIAGTLEQPHPHVYQQFTAQPHLFHQWPAADEANHVCFGDWHPENKVDKVSKPACALYSQDANYQSRRGAPHGTLSCKYINYP